MSFFEEVFLFIRDTAYFLRSPYSFTERCQILGTLCKLSLKQFFTRAKSEKIHGRKIFFHSYKFIVILYREIFYRGQYASVQKNPRHILDIGANIGMTSLFYHWKYPQAKITAVEASPQTLKYLTKNLSFPQATVVHTAVHPKRGFVDFFIETEQKDSGMNSLFVNRSHGQKVKVPSAPISDFITPQTDIVKIDIEGAEMLLVDDIVKKPVFTELFMEVHHNIAQDKLGQLFENLENKGFVYHIDTFFFHKNHVKKVQDICLFAYKKK